MSNKFQTYYLTAADEETAKNAANIEGYDLVLQDEETQELRWNTSPRNGKSAFAVTRGPIVGTETDEEDNEIPVYAEGFFALLRVRKENAAEIEQLIEAAPEIDLVPIEEAQARFAGEKNDK